jgi:hypothetical protein
MDTAVKAHFGAGHSSGDLGPEVRGQGLVAGCLSTLQSIGHRLDQLQHRVGVGRLLRACEPVESTRGHLSTVELR